jgi:hypothetical protein
MGKIKVNINEAIQCIGYSRIVPIDLSYAKGSIKKLELSREIRHLKDEIMREVEKYITIEQTQIDAGLHLRAQIMVVDKEKFNKLTQAAKSNR